LVIFLGLVVGLFFFAVGTIYFLVPADHLPTFMPGYDRGVSEFHLTHALGSLVIAILGFVMAALRAWGD
jgi:hypothetical protein